MLKGIGASPGIVLGKALVIEETELVIERKTINDTQAEVTKLKDAVAISKEELTKVKEKALAELGEHEAEIFEAHLLVLEDPELIGSAISKIRDEKVNADYALNEIKEIMINPKYDKIEALNKHKELLIEKRKRIDGLVTLIDKTIKGDNNMSFKEFDNSKIEENKRKYSEEVKKRWGNTDAYKEYEKKTTSYDKNSWNTINEEMAKISLLDKGVRYYTSTPEMLKKYAEMIPPVDEQK